MHSIRPYPNELFSVMSFVGFMFCCIPLPLHLRAGRTCTVLLMVWAGLFCLITFINSIVWNGNAINWAPVWCDISAKFIVGVSVALPGTSLCITRHLYLVSHASHPIFTKREKRNQLIFDLGVGVGIPVLQMALQYVIQGHRFNIYEDIGCYPFSYIVPVTFPIVYGIPFLIGLVSVMYGFLTIRTLRKSHRRFRDVVNPSADSNLNSSHYVQLMLLAAVVITGEFAVNLYFLLIAIRHGMIHPWISWANTHWGFSRVDQIPVIVWRSWGIQAIALDTTRWIAVTCAFVFFAFFGFSKECRDQYRSVFVWFWTKAGFRQSMQPGCTKAPLPQMKFKTVLSAESAVFRSSASRASIVTLPEPALTRNESNLDLDVSSSVWGQSHSTIFTSPSGAFHPPTADALSNV